MFGFLKNTQQMNTKGIGLGLYFSNKIVQEFGGQIIVKSEYKKGTRFTFSFVLENEIDGVLPASDSLNYHDITTSKMLEEVRSINAVNRWERLPKKHQTAQLSSIFELSKSPTPATAIESKLEIK